MPRRLSLAAVGFLLLAAEASASASQIEQGRTVLVGLTVVDGTGSAPLREARVVIEGGRFACVSGPAGCPAMPGDRVDSLAGDWMLPGLIDTHVHLPWDYSPDAADRQQRLRFSLGITTVRDAGSLSVEAALQERERAEHALQPTPRIVVSAHADTLYAGRWGVERGPSLVEHLIAMGVEAIKIKDPFEGDSWLSEIGVAVEHGIPTYGHYWEGPPPQVFAEEAIRAGINGFSHLMGIAPGLQSEASPPMPDDSAIPGRAFESWRKRLWLTMDPIATDELIRSMVEAGVWLEPGLVQEYYWGRPMSLPQGSAVFTRSFESLVALVALQESTHSLMYPEVYPEMERFVRDFAGAGGMLVAGSDGVRPGFDLHEEIRLLTRAGLTPLAALRAATSDAALALGREDIGAILPGRLADALLYDSDPLLSAAGTLGFTTVIKGGLPYDAQMLRTAFVAEYPDLQADRNQWPWAITSLLLAVGALSALAVFLGMKRASARGAEP